MVPAVLQETNWFGSFGVVCIVSQSLLLMASSQNPQAEHYRQVGEGVCVCVEVVYSVVGCGCMENRERGMEGNGAII